MGLKALVAGSLRKELFFAASLSQCTFYFTEDLHFLSNGRIKFFNYLMLYSCSSGHGANIFIR